MFGVMLFVQFLYRIYLFRLFVMVFLQDIFVQNIDVKWDDIIGLDHAKRLSKEAVVYPIKVSLDLIKVSNKSQKRMFSFDKSLILIKNVHMNQRYVIVSLNPRI